MKEPLNYMGIPSPLSQRGAVLLLQVIHRLYLVVIVF